MSDSRHLWVLCYDVEDNTARRRIADLLLEQSVRVQRSVFEGRMSDEAARRIAQDVLALMSPADSFRAYRLSDHARRKTICLGGAPMAEQGDFWIV